MVGEVATWVLAGLAQRAGSMLYPKRFLCREELKSLNLTLRRFLMNKKLIALAVAGATFAPAVMAQSANPVTLYGRAWEMVNSMKAEGGATSVSRRTTVVNESSLIGIRGTEDVGGGLKAFFQLEMGFTPEENVTSVSALNPVPTTTPLSINNSVVSGRNSGVGLQGGFGSVIIGRWDSPFKLSAIFVDPYGQNTIGNQLAVINTSDFNRREVNMVQYWSPTINGFSLRAMYGANEGKANARAAVAANPTTGAPIVPAVGATNPNSVSVSLDYAAGPFRINYANEKHKDTRGAVVTADVTEKGQNLAATAVFGPFKIGALTQKIKSTDRTDKKAYQASLTYTVGMHEFMATVGRVKDGGLTTAGVIQPESKLSTVGYNYNFSKRTTFMARYASLKNNVAANVALNASGLPGIVVDADPKGMGVGVRHTF
jgi:predicted porin